MKFQEGAVVFLCGNKGVGKSTVLAYLANRFIRQKHEVYSNFEIAGTWLFNAKDFGKVKFPNGSAIIIDESALEFNSRQFKSFDLKITKFIKKCRHHHCMLIFASQTYNDTDKVIRDSSDYLYVLYKYGSFTIGKRITNELVLVPSQNGNSGYMGFDLHWSGLLTKNSRLICFRPLYYKYFDSWVLDSDDEMPPVNAQKVPLRKKGSILNRLVLFLRHKTTRQQGELHKN